MGEAVSMDPSDIPTLTAEASAQPTREGQNNASPTDEACVQAPQSCEFAEEGADTDCPDIMYVCEKVLDSLREKLRLGEEIAPDLISDLTLEENIADDEIMVPVDMRGMELGGDDSEHAAEAL